MSDQNAPVGNEPFQPLQLDRVITESAASASPDKPVVVCEFCQTSIDTEYYHVNGTMCCEGCRRRLESATETPRGFAPLVVAGAFGLGAGIVGAAIYYAVIAITHLEIGIVAILIGYVVGRAVRKGARGHGGLRFQILAVALTYVSVALAYTPLVIQEMRASRAQSRQAAASTSDSNRPAVSATDAAPDTRSRPSGGSLLLGLAMLLGFILALPVLAVFGSLPTSLIGGVIIGFGMQQAWKMTAAPRLDFLGPYRVGAAEPAVAST
jgi:hypothetical protein